jgi:hypothetical protein
MKRFSNRVITTILLLAGWRAAGELHPPGLATQGVGVSAIRRMAKATKAGRRFAVQRVCKGTRRVPVTQKENDDAMASGDGTFVVRGAGSDGVMGGRAWSR